MAEGMATARRALAEAVVDAPRGRTLMLTWGKSSDPRPTTLNGRFFFRFGWRRFSLIWWRLDLDWALSDGLAPDEP